MTRRGWLVLASDAAHLYAHLEQGRAIPDRLQRRRHARRPPDRARAREHAVGRHSGPRSAGDAALPRGAALLKVIGVAENGQVAVKRADIYDAPVPFVPFTKLQGEGIKGTLNQR